MQAPGHFRHDNTFAAAQYRFHIDGLTADRTRAYMDKEAAEMQRGELTSMMAGDDSSELFAKMACYFKDVPGTPGYHHYHQSIGKAYYRTLALIEQRSMSYFQTMTSAEPHSPFIQAMLHTAANPVLPGVEGITVSDFDPGSWVERHGRVSGDPGVTHLASIEQLFSLQKFSHAIHGADPRPNTDNVCAVEGQKRGIGEHLHDNIVIGMNMGLPRPLSTDPDERSIHPRPAFRTAVGLEHIQRYFAGAVGVAHAGGVADDKWTAHLRAIRRASFAAPSTHPAAGPDREGDVAAAAPDHYRGACDDRAARQNEGLQQLQMHVCRHDRCLKVYNKAAIKSPKSKVIVLGTSVAVRRLISDCGEDKVAHEVNMALRRLDYGRKRRHCKVHAVKPSRAPQMHCDVTPTVLEAAVAAGHVVVFGTELKVYLLADKEVLYYCSRGHPAPPRSKPVIKRSARKSGDPQLAVDMPLRVVYRPERENSLAAAWSNPHAAFGAGGCCFGGAQASNGDLTVLIAESGVGHTFKYTLKEGPFGVMQSECLRKALSMSEQEESNLAAARGLVVQAMVDCERQKSVSGADIFRYLMDSCYNGGTCHVARSHVNLPIGGNCGTDGASRGLGVEIDDAGELVFSVSKTAVQICRQRMQLSWKGKAIPAHILACLNMFVFSAQVAYDPTTQELSLNMKCVAVRIIPDLSPTNPGEPFFQQCCNVYMPHVWEGSDEATQAHLKGSCEDWCEAWTLFNEQTVHVLPHAMAMIRWGLPGAPQIPLLHLLMPRDVWVIDEETQLSRHENLEAIKSGKRDKSLGLGSSDISLTDVEEPAIHDREGPAQQASSEDDLGEFGLVGMEGEADEYAAILELPKPPDGWVASGSGGYLSKAVDAGSALDPDDDYHGVEGTIRAAEEYLDRHRDAYLAGQPMFVPACQRLFEVGDCRSQLDPGQAELLHYLRTTLDDGKTIRCFVTGEAGSGKTFTVKQACLDLRRRWGLSKVEAADAIKVVASSGSAAANACGETLHQLYGIKVGTRKGKPHLKPRGGSRLAAIEQMARAQLVLIVEEAATVGTYLWLFLDTRLRELRGQNGVPHPEAFGGLHVIAMGDIDQLPPVKDGPPSYPVVATVGDDGKLLPAGSRLFHDIVANATLKLTVQHRQDGCSVDDLAFARALNNAKTGANDEADFKLLASRTRSGMGAAAFDAVADDPNCVHLFGRNRDAVSRNSAASAAIDPDFRQNPVFAVAADQSKNVARLDTQQGGGIPGVFTYRRGAVAMLRRNYLTAAGVVNGVRVIMIDVLISERSPRLDGQPNACLVAILSSQCTLPSFRCLRYVDPVTGEVPLQPDGRDRYTIIPIPPIRNSQFDDCRPPIMSGYRTGIPLVWAYAMTIHKSQGLTLPLVCVHLNRSANPGADYVAMSRGVKITGFVIAEDICGKLTHRRLQQIGYRELTRKPKRKKIVQIKMREQARMIRVSAETIAQYRLLDNRGLLVRRVERDLLPALRAAFEAASEATNVMDWPERELESRVAGSKVHMLLAEVGGALGNLCDGVAECSVARDQDPALHWAYEHMENAVSDACERMLYTEVVAVMRRVAARMLRAHVELPRAEWGYVGTITSAEVLGQLSVTTIYRLDAMLPGFAPNWCALGVQTFFRTHLGRHCSYYSDWHQAGGWHCSYYGDWSQGGTALAVHVEGARTETHRVPIRATLSNPQRQLVDAGVGLASDHEIRLHVDFSATWLNASPTFITAPDPAVRHHDQAPIRNIHILTRIFKLACRRGPTGGYFSETYAHEDIALFPEEHERSWCQNEKCRRCNSVAAGVEQFHFLSVKEYECPSDFLYHMRMRELMVVSKRFKSIVERCYVRHGGFYSAQTHGLPWLVKT